MVPKASKTAIEMSKNVGDKAVDDPLDLAAPAREDCLALLLAACHNGHSDCTLSAAVLPWRPEENLKYTKKTEQTRTIRQIHKDLTYHNSAELDSFSHIFMWSAAVDVVLGPSCSPIFLTSYRSLGFTFMTS
ncbi:hypothetical protein TNCV_3933021 [Trichonephila clavipes]|nr:hypothetical protein TNCV_3933021 [Trichonephila clavipes]